MPTWQNYYSEFLLVPKTSQSQALPRVNKIKEHFEMKIYQNAPPKVAAVATLSAYK